MYSFYCLFIWPFVKCFCLRLICAWTESTSLLHLCGYKTKNFRFVILFFAFFFIRIQCERVHEMTAEMIHLLDSFASVVWRNRRTSWIVYVCQMVDYIDMVFAYLAEQQCKCIQYHPDNVHYWTIAMHLIVVFLASQHFDALWIKMEVSFWNKGIEHFKCFGHCYSRGQ